jgi:hypothetical protein
MTSKISGGDYGAIFRSRERKIVLIAVAAALAILAFAATPALAEPIRLKSLEVTAENEPTAEQKAYHEPGSLYMGEPGSPDVQAGSHPYALITSFRLNGPEEVTEPGQPPVFLSTGGGLKDVSFELPPGFVGNPNATPKCNYNAFSNGFCPNDTAVGEATTTLTDGEGLESIVSNAVYNLETPGGVAAEFGYIVKHDAPVYIDASVRTGGDYGITVNVRNIPQVRPVLASKVTIWGVPEAAVHDPIRGTCLAEAENHPEEGPHDEEQAECGASTAPGAEPVEPLLTNPTSCGVPRTATMWVDGWREAGSFLTGELRGETVAKKQRRCRHCRAVKSSISARRSPSSPMANRARPRRVPRPA